MKKNIKYLAVGLIVFGIFLAWFAFMFSSTGKPAKEAAPEPVAQTPKKEGGKAVVFVRALEAGHRLTPQDLEVREVANDAHTQPATAYFPHPSALIGKTLAHEVAEGMPVTAVDLVSGIAGMLGEGERAVAVKVEEATAVGHKIQPGDWVDVLVVFRKDSQEVPDTQARKLLERRKVLAYGVLTDMPQPILPASPKENGTSKPDPATPALPPAQPARTAVLAVRAEEVNALVLAERQGQIMLALRSPLEKPASAPEQPAAPHMVVALSNAAHASVDTKNVLTLSSLAQHDGQEKNTQLLAKPVAPVSPPVTAQSTKVKAVPKPPPKDIGTPVEFIRGTRIETVHY